MLSPSAGSMRFRCWTERDTGGDDPYGGGESWTAVLASQRCLWWVSSGREQIDDQRSVVLAEEHLIVPHGVDVVEGDRVVKVTDEMGRTVFDGSRREVEHVGFGRQHVDCSLRSVN